MKTLRALFNPLNVLIGAVLFLFGCPFFGIGAYEAIEAQQEAKTSTILLMCVGGMPILAFLGWVFLSTPVFLRSTRKSPLVS
ncbi:MAG TPA: hypothetical protein VI451_04430 [Anaerolineales bacterium]|nr:hypothetical protein [Anaerolineales bacterium]